MLVDPTFNSFGTKIPAKYSNALENGEAGLTFDSTNLKLVLGMRFISAMGLECRHISIYQIKDSSDFYDDVTARVACTSQKQYDNQIRAWYLVPNITQSSSSVDL